MSRSLNELPPELLERIFLICSNRELPLVNKAFLSISLSPYVRSKWLLNYYKDPEMAIRRGIKKKFFNLKVLKILEEKLTKNNQKEANEATKSGKRGFEGNHYNDSNYTSRRRGSTDTHHINFIYYSDIPIPKHLFDLTFNVEDKVTFLQELLARNLSLVENGGYGLVMACKYKNYVLAELLLSNGVNPNYKDCLSLRIACQNGDKELVDILLRYEVELVATAVKLAVKHNHKFLAETLISKGAKVDMETIHLLYRKV